MQWTRGKMAILNILSLSSSAHLKVMGNEKKGGGVKVVSIDRSCFSELTPLIFILL